MQQLRLLVPAALTDAVLDVLDAEPSVSGLAVIRGASLRPHGDVVLADVTRETVNDVVDQLIDVGVQQEGTIQIGPVPTWVSRPGFEAEQADPGSAADAMNWPEVTQRAYEDSELNWTYLSFMIMATVIAAIGIVLDSQILTIGSMVLGPEFGAIAALGLAIVRRRTALLGFAFRTLVLGFAVAIAATTLLSLLARALGWVTPEDVTGSRPDTAFIYSPDTWSVIVAVIAAAAGVLSLMANKVGGLSGVFISVTTVPAAGNVALGIAFGAWSEVSGSALQLLINIGCMATAGALTLALRGVLWPRLSLRARLFPRLSERARRL
ncbi:MAG TPA: DUF389 domain-containing protein [Microlunatus sp.]|nr:DUF389 domain-containing protein [Microlunatus sp.]